MKEYLKDLLAKHKGRKLSDELILKLIAAADSLVHGFMQDNQLQFNVAYTETRVIPEGEALWTVQNEEIFKDFADLDDALNFAIEIQAD